LTNSSYTTIKGPVELATQPAAKDIYRVQEVAATIITSLYGDHLSASDDMRWCSAGRFQHIMRSVSAGTHARGSGALHASAHYLSHSIEIALDGYGVEKNHTNLAMRASESLFRQIPYVCETQPGWNYYRPQ
jgi:hypothetical protein